jgi:hypothetical protein
VSGSEYGGISEASGSQVGYSLTLPSDATWHVRRELLITVVLRSSLLIR